MKAHTQITADLADAIGSLVAAHRDGWPEEAKKTAEAHLADKLKALEDAAFKRGYDARQQELISNLRAVHNAWKRPGL